jgi:predicted nucleic acid-binding Zn finger protein
VVDLGQLTFTLGLSGWTDNDWTGGAAKFDLLSRRLNVSAADLMKTYEALRKVRYAADTAVASDTGLGVEKTRSALAYLCQVGRGMYDLGGRVYRHRELFAGPFTIQEAAAAVKPAAQETTPQAKAARQIFEAGNVFITARRKTSTQFKLSGSAKGADGARVRPLLSVDFDGAVVEATCSCPFFSSNKLTKGPCEHILALRLAHMARLESEDATKGGGGES